MTPRFTEWLLMEAKRTATELADEFLKGKTDVWLSAKQGRWLRDVLGREMGDVIPDNRTVSFGPFTLKRCSPLNKACILTKTAPAPATPPPPQGGPSVQVSSQVQFMDAMLVFAQAGLRAQVDYTIDINRLSFYPKTPEAFQKMSDVAIDKDYLIQP